MSDEKQNAPLSLAKARNEEAAKKSEEQKGAAFENDMRMQSEFFNLRHRFFVLYIDKFPMAEQSENMELAHEAAKIEFLTRHNDAKKMVQKGYGMKMEDSTVFKLLSEEGAKNV